MTGTHGWPVAIEGVGPVACATTVWRTHGQLRVTVVVKASFELVDGRPAPQASPDAIAAEDARDAAGAARVAGDLAPYVPRADVLFTGYAHAPPGQVVPTASVRLGVAAGERVLVDKTLHLFGHRIMPEPGAEQLPPQPFERMPIVYERAHRGSGFDENPVGVVPAPGGALPCVVDPTDPDGPAGLGPIAPDWPVRKRLLRGLDPAALAAAVPEIPDAFAWSYFHAAPADQRCPFLRGDEWIVLDGLVHELPRLVTRLPGAHAAARVHGMPGAPPGSWIELELVADTLRIDGEARRITVTWRGNLPVPSVDALRTLRVVAGVELPGQPIAWPAPAGGALEIDDAPTQIVTRTDLSAAHQPVESSRGPDHDATVVAKHPLLAELAARTAAVAWDIEDPITDEPATLARPPSGRASFAIDDPETVGQDPEALADLLEASRAELASAAREAADRAAEKRAAVERRLAAGAPLDGMDLAGADLSSLDLARRSLAGANLREASLRKADLTGADLRGANLGRADLSDATLDGANLERADFYGAVVSGASFAGTALTDANFSTARGEGARFVEARGERPLFGGGRWAFARFDEAQLTGADFTEAVLDDARFDGAALPEIRLYEARAPGAVFDEATMAEARADAANLKRASFARVYAPDSVWDEAALDGSCFRGAMLPGASFVRASCLHVDFSEAELAEARLKRARLEGARFARTDVSKATFEGADLSRTDLRDVQRD